LANSDIKVSDINWLLTKLDYLKGFVENVKVKELDQGVLDHKGIPGKASLLGYIDDIRKVLENAECTRL
jgi:hypothetical protein